MRPCPPAAHTGGHAPDRTRRGDATPALIAAALLAAGGVAGGRNHARAPGRGLGRGRPSACGRCGHWARMAGMISGRQISATMALLDWTREETAKRAGVAGTDVYHLDKRAIVERALTKGGIEFQPEDMEKGEGVPMRRPRPGAR